MLYVKKIVHLINIICYKDVIILWLNLDTETKCQNGPGSISDGTNGLNSFSLLGHSDFYNQSHI